MTVYEYACVVCRHRVEHAYPMGTAPDFVRLPDRCPQCGGRFFKRVFTPPNVHSGVGFDDKPEAMLKDTRMKKDRGQWP